MKQKIKELTDFRRIVAFLLAILLISSIVLSPSNVAYAAGELYNIDSLPNELFEYPEEGQQFWVLFTEGCRSGRFEMSTFDVTGTGAASIKWNQSLIAQCADGSVSQSNQFHYTSSGWVYDRTYSILSDYAMTVIASNVNVYDKNGNLLVAAGSWGNSNNYNPQTHLYNGHTYMLYDDSMTWTEAKAFCERIGGHLATITSEEEQSVINQLLLLGSRNSYWVGGYRSSQNSYLWVTGESFDNYTNWAFRQPDHADDFENSLMVYRNINPNISSSFGEWNDLSENGVFEDESFFGLDNIGFICEWDSECQHIWDSGMMINHPTCTDYREIQYTCTLCGRSYIDVLDPLGHDFVNGTCLRCKTSAKLGLSSTDYLAFSQIVYEDWTNGVTVEQGLQDKWNKEVWSETAVDISFSELCRSIANWRVVAIQSTSGFYGVAFESPSHDVVISYRGSVKFGNINLNPSSDWFDDWIKTDIPMVIDHLPGKNNGNQIECAIRLYNSVAEKYQEDHIALTGHSLGGGLGDIVSAYSGCYAETFNAAPFLDIAYRFYPECMSKLFSGVDKFNFADHVNEKDSNVGMRNLDHKPYYLHNNNGLSDSTHSLASFILQDTSGEISLTPCSFHNAISSKWVMWPMAQIGFDFFINLGSSNSETINALTLTDAYYPHALYGGLGNDIIYGSIWPDILSGGTGSDTIDGNYGNDVYYYNYGDGYTRIADIAGKNELYIIDYPLESLTFQTDSKEPDWLNILFNDQKIISIYRLMAKSFMNHFSVNVCTGGEIVEIDITNEVYRTKYKSRIKVKCPVDLQIIDDATGNPVLYIDGTKEDAYYTPYGTFYVLEESDGDFTKIADLIEGYSLQIMGNDEGTMDVSYQISDGFELGKTYEATDIPVTNTMVASIAEDGSDSVMLIVDEEGDGQNSIEIELLPICDGEHSYEPLVTAPTCTEDGYTTYTCSVCGDSYTADEVPALGHKLVSHAAKAASCTEAGWKAYETCERCDYTTYAAAAKLGHDYRAKVTKPTCTENGYTTHTCSRCGDKFTDSKTAALNHSYEAGYCTRCGEKDPTYTRERPHSEICPSNDYSDAPAYGSWAHEGIDYCIEHELMNGVGGGLFNPNGTVTRAQLVMILYRVANQPKVTTAGTFADVEAGMWYSDAIEWAAASSIVNGVGDRRFDPMGNITREQIATILYRYEGSPKVNGTLAGFPDSGNVHSYAENALIWATGEGLINGIKSGEVTTLAPQNNATRAQIASIIMRYLES